MKELLEALERLYANQDDICQEGEDTGFNESELLDEVVGLCDDHLIASGGQCNWENIRILERNGYRVYAGDQDSWGWLTGCVQKKGDKRVIVYG